MGEDPADIETQTPLSRLLSLIKKTDEISVRSEGTRVLVNLVKNLWSEHPDATSGNCYYKKKLCLFTKNLLFLLSF
jgi:hypothetical protein